MMNKLPGKNQDMKGLRTQTIMRSPESDPMRKVVLTANDTGKENTRKKFDTYQYTVFSLVG